MMHLLVVVSAIFGVNTLLVAGLTLAFRSKRFAAQRISSAAPIQVSTSHRLKTMAVISTLSLVTIYGASYLLSDRLVHERPAPIWMIALQALAILLIYDFAYYFAHRGMHHPKMLRWVHGVHHRARNPSALESFYQHPIELLIGLGLMFASTLAIGPVHLYAFGAAFFVYSNVNILVHSGLDTQRWWLLPFDALARKHHVHHMVDPKKNYSSLTLLPDLVFGTHADLGRHPRPTP